MLRQGGVSLYGEINNRSQKSHMAIFWNKVTETSSTCNPQACGNTLQIVSNLIKHEGLDQVTS